MFIPFADIFISCNASPRWGVRDRFTSSVATGRHVRRPCLALFGTPSRHNANATEKWFNP